jgi:Sec23-binding domain of Sec16
VEDLVVRGEREAAIEEAIASGDFATAFLIASYDPAVVRLVAQRYSESMIFSQSPLRSVGLLFSGTFRSSAEAGLGKWGVPAEELAKTWKSHLAAIISNRSAAGGSDQMIASLGERLHQDGDIIAAHFCFMVGGIPLGSPTNSDTKMALLGCDQKDQSTLALQTEGAVSAYERTEAFEWAKQQGNKKAKFIGFQAYKFVFAMNLIGTGEGEQALSFLDSICISFSESSSDVKSVYLSDLFGSQSALALAVGQVQQDMLSVDAKTFIEGGELKISHVPPASRAGFSAPGPSETIGGSGLLPHQGSTGGFIPATPMDQQQHSLSQDSPYVQPTPHSKSDPDATFATAKSNLMDVTGYSLDQGDSQIHDQHNPSISEAPPPVNSLQSTFIAMPIPAQSNTEHMMGNDLKPSEPPSNTPFPGNANKQAPKPEKLRPMSPPVTAPPVMMGKKNNKKEAPKTPAPSSSGARRTPIGTPLSGIKSWIIKKFNPDATECELPEEEEKAYYDNERKRWIFPGDDPDEVAKPIAPPPIMSAAPEAAPKPANDAPLDPLAAMMAPPGSRIPSAKKKKPGMTGPGGRGGPIGFPPGMMPPTGPTASMTSPSPAAGASAGGPPPPQFAVFTPKPSAPDKEE